GLGIEPAALVQQASQAQAIDAVLLDGVLVVDAGDQALVGSMQQRHARRLVDATALGLDDAVLDLVAHAQAVAPTDAVGLQHEFDQVVVLDAIEGYGTALVEAHRDLFGGNLDL